MKNFFPAHFLAAAILSPAALTPTLALAQPAETQTDMVRVDKEQTPITAVASSEFSAAQAAKHLIDGAGMADDRHDADGGAGTMWHTAVNATPSAPAPGLASAPAWVRFDFKDAAQVDEIKIWNHNQAGLTNRGFRQLCVYGTVDGNTWFPMTKTKTVTLKEGGATAASVPVNAPKKVKAIILAAQSNFGGNVYGLSAVKFYASKQVAADAQPFPSGLEARPKNIYLHRADGKPGREVTLLLKGARLYGAAEAQVAVEGGATETTAIPANAAGRTQLTVLLPDGVGVDKEAKVALTLRSGKSAVTQSFTVPMKRQWTVFLYPHSHVDIGYTQPQDIVEKITVRNLRVGMDIARQTAHYPEGARYVWNPEVVWAAENFLKAATPAEKNDFFQAVHKGQVGLDGSFAHLDTSTCSDEELLRSFEVGAALAHKAGATVDTMVQMDVPGASWGLPTAAAQHGIKAVLDFPNGFDRIGDIHHHFERPFWWVAPDGKSRILYIQGPRYDLGWGWKLAQMPSLSNLPVENPAPSWGQNYPLSVDRVKTATPGVNFIPMSFIEENTAAIEREGLPYDYFTMTWSMSDNSIVDADLPDAVKAWNEKYAYPKLVIASGREIAAAYEKKFGKIIPERRGDLTEYWTDGLGSDALRTGYNQLSKERLIQAETLRSMLGTTRGAAAFNAAVGDAWRWVFLGSEHTWGYFRPDHPIAKQVEATKASYFENGKKASEQLMAQTLASATQADGNAITVFNTLSWRRDGLATLPEGVEGITDENGTVPLQQLADGKRVFIAKDLPALGAKNYLIGSATREAGLKTDLAVAGTTLENALVKVVLDPKTGDIAHLTDKRTGRDFADAKSPYALNSYRYLKGGDPAAQASGPTEVKISVKERGPVVASLLVESKAQGCNKLTREIRLLAGQPQVEILNTVDKIATRKKEGIHFGFAFNVPDGKIRMDIPWGVMTPETDQLPGANKNWLAFQRWIDVSNGQDGITWTSTEAPIVEIGDITANLLGGAHDLRLWRKKIEPTQTLFSWALNNHWHTNFPLEQGGVIPFHYAMLPHGAFDAAAANRFGMEENRPLLAVRSDGKAAPLAPVAVDNPRVVITTVKSAEDGSNALIFRLRSLSSQPETVHLSFPAGAPKSIHACLADEKPGAQEQATVTVPPMGCAGFRLEK